MAWGCVVSGEAAELEVGFVDAACAEFEVFCAGSLCEVRQRIRLEQGELLVCGSPDFERWNAVYVHASDRATVPVAVGDGAEVMKAVLELSRSGAELGDRAVFRPPLVLLGGARCVFEAAQGASLLGVVRQGSRAVLLAGREQAVAVVYVEGKTRQVLKVGLCGQIGEVDVDGILAARRGRGGGSGERAARAAKSTTVAATTRGHHLRLVGEAPVEVGDGPPVARVLDAIFEAVEGQAAEVRAPTLRRALGVLPRVLGCMKVLAIEGYGNLGGRVSGIRALLQRRFPDFDVGPRDLASVLKLVEATGLGLVGRPPSGGGKPGRIWEVRLTGLGDPSSAAHRELCAAIRGRSLGSAEGALARPRRGRRSGRQVPGAEVGAGRAGEGEKSQGGSEVPTSESEARVEATLASAVCAALVGVVEGGRAAEERIAEVEAARDAAVAERDAAVAERDAAVAERDAAVAEVGAARRRIEVLEAARDSARAAVVAVDAAREEAVFRGAALERENAALRAEIERVVRERDEARAEARSRAAEAELARGEALAVGAERDEARAQAATLEATQAADRAAACGVVETLGALLELVQAQVVVTAAERDDARAMVATMTAERGAAPAAVTVGETEVGEGTAEVAALTMCGVIETVRARWSLSPRGLLGVVRGPRPEPDRGGVRRGSCGARRSRVRGRCAVGTLGARGPP